MINLLQPSAQASAIQSFDRPAMSGGTLAFNDNITGSSKADGHISVNSLELDNAKGTVQVKAGRF